MPPIKCSYFGCKNTTETKSMFRFPLDGKRTLLWLENCGNMTITHLPIERLRQRFICIDHFDDKYIRNKNGRRKRLDKVAVPIPYYGYKIDEREASPMPAISDLEVLLPIRVYRNRKVTDPNDDCQQTSRKIKKKPNQEYKMPSFIALLDQTKLVIAKVYHYFEQEYEELKKSFEGLELTPLSKFRQRTALATGVSETTVLEILQEEARRNAEREEQSRNAEREEQSRKESLARKRPRQTDSSSEEDTESNDDGDDEQSSAAHEEETLVVKEEPAEESLESCNEEPEIYAEPAGTNDTLADPISIDIKTEPKEEEATSSNDTHVVQRTRKAYKGRKMKRNTEAPPAASGPPTTNAPPAVSAPPITNAPPGVSAPPTTNAPPAASAPPAQPRRQLLLLDEGEIKMEETELDEGFS